ncbi:hypothetical protein C7974DRAFT_376384 [Boeremia exigua]|uniref:uncharacterized protein n=1 Tax=Boeremia exigua TaxID=749465 RepID=UPI001E8ED0C2|nr:uncharacterized protein C7974DRAFT_376384 [Boeremia exigua]KAH6629558.1 hypothetical protein C7974DRAFT_376384 [Boeremia exigua]
MSKRPLSPPPGEVVQRDCLDFDEWKAQRLATEGIKRGDDSVYDPSTEELPAHMWYALDQKLLRKTVAHMCDQLGRPVVNCEINDPEITDLLRALDRAKKIPLSKKVDIAVVGNQGVGKSSTINALLNRDLVDASASSSACTAFATIVEYKDGATDDTDESDLKVTFLELDEVRDFVEEQIRRYTDVYAPFEANNDIEAQEEDGVLAKDIVEDSVSEFEVSDSDLSDATESPIASKKKRKKVSKAVQLGADTAEQFFRILFSAHLDEEKEAELQSWLGKTDLEDGQFLEHCVRVATEHLGQIQAEEQGSVEYSDVKDMDLQKVRSHATTMWPLVKAVTISTGSVLLSNGIRFMDLPGYGDMNQTRTAVVNEFRSKAHFEMIVAKSDRYLSKTDEDRFLDRAVRHHGARNVFLVLNKADSCLETPQHQVIRTMKDETEEPFMTIQHHISGLKSLRGEARSVVQQYRRYLIREAQMAGGRRESDKIQRKMQKKGVRVFSVSSARYLDWLDPSPLEDPPYDPAGTNIPLLRQSLLMLPAEASYENLRYHIFETVTDIEDKVSRILMKFTNDVDVSAIRRYLLEQVSVLDSNLKNLSISVPNSLVSEAWNEAAKCKVADGMKMHLNSLPEVDLAYQTFWLLLRNNGIATHGSYRNRNLNDELMQTYKSTIRYWRNKTTPEVVHVHSQFNAPVQATLSELEQRLSAASSDPELKRRVGEALDKLSRRIDQGESRLLEELYAALNENYRRFTTEDDIRCPVARELRSAYVRINMIRMDERPKHRKGIYRDQRAELIRTTTETNNDEAPLIDAISIRVKCRQCRLWGDVGNEFTDTVLAHFEEFAQALAELLENEMYMLEAHKLVRKQLGEQLLGFSRDLALVKGQFVEPETLHVAKKARVTAVKQEVLE